MASSLPILLAFNGSSFLNWLGAYRLHVPKLICDERVEGDVCNTRRSGSTVDILLM